MIILSRNECPYPPSPLVIEYLSKYIHDINRYEVPGLYGELIDRIANYNSIDSRYIELLLGSEEFFTILPWFLIRDNCKFIYFSPTFTPVIEDLYPWGIELVDVELNENFAVDLGKALSVCSDKTVFYIVRPNNPTGNLPISCEEVVELAKRSRLVIVDEAYYEFSNQTCVDLVYEYNNIVILRTLSKAFCIAGARLGYMISSPETISELVRIRRKYSIPASSIFIGLGATSDLEYMRKIVNEILRVKKYTIDKLREVPGVEVVDTLTNFILVSKKRYESKILYEKLVSNGIVVKPLENRLSKYVRVSIGREDEMDKFIDVMKRV